MLKGFNFSTIYLLHRLLFFVMQLVLSYSIAATSGAGVKLFVQSLVYIHFMLPSS